MSSDAGGVTAAGFDGTADIFSFKRRSRSFTRSTPFAEPATLLRDGRVLILGGTDGQSIHAAARRIERRVHGVAGVLGKGARTYRDCR